jgi:predicted glycoside hydrolase/deacetylase ChbG (UPF0249 family)
MKRRVIINADAMGIDEPRSRGILEAHRKGIVTSTSVLANSLLLEMIAAWARESPRLGMGVHLNLTEGAAILSHPRTLTSRHGQFFGKEEARRRLMEGRIDPEEIQTEFDLQIRRVRDAGIEPTHLDSHDHVHLYPRVMTALCWAGRRHGLTRVRLPREPVPAPGALSSQVYWEMVRCQGLVPRAAEILAAEGYSTTEHFRGTSLTGGIHFDRFADMLAKLPEGTTEVMVHPGLRGPGSTGFVGEDRQRELNLLTDPETRKAIETYGIGLISFRDL